MTPKQQRLYSLVDAIDSIDWRDLSAIADSFERPNVRSLASAIDNLHADDVAQLRVLIYNLGKLRSCTGRLTEARVEELIQALDQLEEE